MSKLILYLLGTMALETTPSANSLGQLILSILQSPWLQVVFELGNRLRMLWSGWVEEGIYEVLEHESTLELVDAKGKHATVRKRQIVRFLQNGTLAFQDQAWGDGEILANYRCSPGVAVDFYRPGPRPLVLIALREVKNRGDVSEFHIEWDAYNGFTRPSELWASEVSHRMRHFKITVIFPRNRPPKHYQRVIGPTGRKVPLDQTAFTRLSDGRTSVSWQTDKPRLYETYAIEWEW